MTTFAAAAKSIDTFADAVGADAQANADVMLRRRVYWLDKIAADAMASTTTAVLAELGECGYVKDAFTVEQIFVQPLGSLTASDSVYATISLWYDNGAGGADTLIKAIETKLSASGGTGSWTAGTLIAVHPTQAVLIPAGSQLLTSIAKASTGTIVPISRYFLVGRLT